MGHIGHRTILVERSLAVGDVKETKTGATRSVRLLGPLAADLQALRIKAGRPDDDALVFARRDGQPWHATGWKNWRRRVFDPSAAAAGLEGVRPYDLRHSFVSLLIAEGRSIVDVARQAGQSPTMSLNTYAHVFDELDGADRRPAENLIRDARVPSVHPRRTNVVSTANKKTRLTGSS